MNRRHIGSSIGSSGEGVWALSCSLFENFTPSDEPTPKHLYTIGSSGAEEIFSFPQTRAQLLRRVIKSGRLIIRCPTLPRSSVAPTVRPTPPNFHRRFIRCYIEAWVLSVITVGGRIFLNLFCSKPRPAAPDATFLLASGDLPVSRAPCALSAPSSVLLCSPPAARAAPPCRSHARADASPSKGLSAAADSGRAPPPRLAVILQEERKDLPFIHNRSSSSNLTLW
jgi:hypothetical protein